MFKQVLLPILAVVIFILAVGIFVQRSSLFNLPIAPTPQSTALPEKTITVGSKTIQAQIANTEDERIKGLSGIKALDINKGMLFVFETKGVTPLFWMKDMLIPLDFIWIGNGKIVRIDKDISAPAPNTPDGSLKAYSAGAPIDYVLEVNAGFSDFNKIKVGDSVNLSGI